MEKTYTFGAKDFTPEHIFENGQAFRWEKEEDGSFTVVAKNHLCNVKKTGNDIILSGADKNDYEEFWKSYFNMNRDYSKLKNDFRKIDINLEKATIFGEGLRVLKQDPFEMIITFIISANNQIPRIKKSVNLIAELMGDKVGEFNGKIYYSFPTAEKLSKITKEQLELLRIGYRDEYILKTAKDIAESRIDLESIYDMETMEAQKYLCQLMGVGPKVADCILLFGYGKTDAFPVDTWVKKVMNEYYFSEEMTNPKKIRLKGLEIFGEDAGLAQQYLFYYARENKLGNK
ncbi:MAG: DNA-3-methyladenine glycosylase family protein [Filifactoraceae bacterium]